MGAPMTGPDPATPAPPARARMRSFHELMQHRVQRILLVSSLYDSFVISEEGQLPEELIGHFVDLDRSHTPDLIQVNDIAAALELLRSDERFDLVVSSLNTSDGNAALLASRMHEAGVEIPVIALGYSGRELYEFTSRHDSRDLERIFLWRGDVRIFLAMVMYLEDRLNVENDSGLQGVPVILLVEDSIEFYSSFLLTIYSELMRHTSQLLSSDMNLSQKMVRMRARPKVLLCTSYEEAWEHFERYEERILGVLSDVEYPRGGTLDKRAGLKLCRRVRARRPDVRLVLQSSRAENRKLASDLGASFLTKGSPVLLEDLRAVLIDRFGFGDFIFRLPDGTEIDRASDLRELRAKIERVPGESIVYHATRGHFPNWLKARTEFALAEMLQAPERGEPEDFGDPEGLRRGILARIDSFREERARMVIAEFDRKRFDPDVSITRIGAGSMGGKARGVAFANRMLQASGVRQRFPDIDIHVPPSVVVATSVFDEFLEYEWTRGFAIAKHEDQEITQLFLQAPFPRAAGADLRSYLQRVRYPLAVRSSSLMEDSLSQPFAGVYRTFMLPNNDFDVDVRLRQMTDAVKRVYASTFAEQAKTYISMSSHRLEEEKMAVMIQQLVGRPHQDRFYPDFAGVARSYNFYPEPGHAAEDGVAAVALGMGKAVVGGDPCLRFCPRYPRQIVGFSSVHDALQNSQRELHALDLSRLGDGDESLELERHGLEVAEEDGLLTWLGSTYVHDDQRIVDGISRSGVRLVTFAQVLKYEAYPLAELLRALLECCAQGTGAPVEIEFAGNLGGRDRRPSFAFLQLRPMALAREAEAVEIGPVSDGALVCRSPRVLGNGNIEDIRDLLVVDIASFDRSRSREVAQQVAGFDALLRAGQTPYVLIGVGRWGSADPHLGIPVSWNQIAGARVIVEAGFEDIRVVPSQGTHFFQNLTSCHVGYFTVNPEVGEGHVDWSWLASQEAVRQTELVRHIRLPRPLSVKMNGRTGEGVILKPD